MSHMHQKTIFFCSSSNRTEQMKGFFPTCVGDQYKFSGVCVNLYYFKEKKKPSNNFVDTDYHFPMLQNTDQWSCPTCSFDNSSTNYPTCDMCLQIDSQHIEDSFMSDSFDWMWICPSCNWKNNANYIFCESCYQTIPASVNI
jgi:hypothetical protein